MHNHRDLQQTFDIVAAHLLSQGKKAQDRYRTCLYRAPNGRTCAAGCLIPDTEYRTWMEHHAIEVIIDRSNMDSFFGHDEDLVVELQRIHDDLDPEQWRGSLRALAHTHNLDTKVLDEFSDIHQTTDV